MGGAAAEPGGALKCPPGLSVLLSVRMRARTALLLLLTLGLTLGFGVHPCGAAEHADGEAQTAPAMPSCHAQTAPELAGEDRSEQGSPDHPCPHVCHATALPAVTPPFLTMQAVATLVVTYSETAFAAPARSIDHVPLS